MEKQSCIILALGAKWEKQTPIWLCNTKLVLCDVCIYVHLGATVCVSAWVWVVHVWIDSNGLALGPWPCHRCVTSSWFMGPWSPAEPLPLWPLMFSNRVWRKATLSSSHLHPHPYFFWFFFFKHSFMTFSWFPRFLAQQTLSLRYSSLQLDVNLLKKKTVLWIKTCKIHLTVSEQSLAGNQALIDFKFEMLPIGHIFKLLKSKCNAN